MLGRYPFPSWGFGSFFKKLSARERPALSPSTTIRAVTRRRARRISKSPESSPKRASCSRFLCSTTSSSANASIEAATLRAIIANKKIPRPEDLNVEPQAYLNGICEAASECRRYALDEMRRGNNESAYRLANEMEDIYDELITFDYPDSLMSNLR